MWLAAVLPCRAPIGRLSPLPCLFTSPSCWGTHFLYLSIPPSGNSFQLFHGDSAVMQYNNIATFIILFLLADLHICGMFPWRMWWKEKDTDKYYNRTLRTHSTYLEIWLTRTPPRTRRKQSPGNDMKFLKRPPAMSAVSILSSVLFIFYMCNLSTLILSHLLHTYKDNLNPKLQSNS